VVYRLGDEVEFKKSGSRRRRSRWVPAKVHEIHRGGMYGELTYTLYLLDSGKIVDFVSKEEMRFRYPRDLERRIKDDEVALWREDMRQINLKFARQQRVRGTSARGRIIDATRAPRGRSLNATRAFDRARSAEKDAYISGKPAEKRERAQSVPPGNRSWPQFLAEFAKYAYRDPMEDYDYSGDNEANDLYPETGNYDLEYPDGGGINLDKMLEHKEKAIATTPPPYRIFTNRGGNFPIDGKDVYKVRGSHGMNVNIYLPGCRGQQVENA